MFERFFSKRNTAPAPTGRSYTINVDRDSKAVLERKRTARRMRREGVSVTQIAKELEVTVGAVYNYLPKSRKGAKNA